MNKNRKQHCTVNKECKIIKFLGVANNKGHTSNF